MNSISHKDLKIELTADGSPTLYSEQFDAHYHSTHGALQESLHVFIQEGVDHFRQLHSDWQELKILEFGMGTGLNAALTMDYAEVHNVSIDYHAVEGYPVPPEVYSHLHFGDGVQIASLTKIHVAEWEQPASLSNHFTLHKEKALFEDLQLPADRYDIIYYDAFAPTCQEHLWEEEILTKAYNSLSEGGILVTFCAKGSFKRVLKGLQMTVERVPGPPGKREMTRATKVATSDIANK